MAAPPAMASAPQADVYSCRRQKGRRGEKRRSGQMSGSDGRCDNVYSMIHGTVEVVGAERH